MKSGFPPEEIPGILLDLVDHLDAMVAYWDVNQVCRFANNAYYAWFGKTRQELIGITLQELLGPLYPKNLPYIKSAYEGHTQVFEREILTPAGKIRHSLATYIPHIIDGHVHGIFVHVADVTPLKIIENELKIAKADAEKLATHDFLTGLHNRVSLVDRIMQALTLAERTHQMVAFLSLDIDDFKEVNDSYGHEAGDKLLIECALRIKSSLRDFDTVTRMGGDEFLIIAPKMKSVEQAEAIAKRILEKARQPFLAENATISPTFSLGIALYPLHGTAPDVLIKSSDRALYAAKKLGKNRYSLASVVKPHSPAA